MHQEHLDRPRVARKEGEPPDKPQPSLQKPLSEKGSPVSRSLSRKLLLPCAALLLCTLVVQAGLAIIINCCPSWSKSCNSARLVASQVDLGFNTNMFKLVSLPVGHASRPSPAARTPPAVTASRVAPHHKPFQQISGSHGTGCGAGLCSVSRGANPTDSLTLSAVSRHVDRTSVATSARAGAAAAASEVAGKSWWKVEADLWVEAHSVDDFQQEVSTGDKLVLVDFFATWCNGCRMAYPQLCNVARDEHMREQFKFVKVCVDEVRALARMEGIHNLPQVGVYHPKEGKVLAIDIPPSKVRHLKHNLEMILLNPGMSYKVDVKGFVVPYPKEQESSEQRKATDAKAEAEALRSAQSGLFERLLSVANAPATTGNGNGRAGVGSTSAASGSNGSSKGASAGSVAAPGLQPFHQPARASHYSPPSLQLDMAKQMFLRRHGQDYGYDGKIDVLYPNEVGCRMAPNEHYLDYTGSSVYCQSQLDAVFSELKTCMFGNPHSANPSSRLSSEKVDEVRDLILQYFNADPALYQVVFTRSATQSLKMVGEMFPWSKGSVFRYLRENHNSVLGVREYALEHEASFESVNETFVERWVTARSPNPLLDHHPAPRYSNPTFNLFAFPLEDNFAGVKYPQRWVEQIHARSTDDVQWKVLVDAAAYVPTQPLDLSRVPADFVAMSFYKMFGYPTGLGALIVRVDAAEVLQKTFWGGGTVALATSSSNFHVLKCKPSDKLEDGTVSFLDIISLKHGFQFIHDLGGIHRVQAHVAALSEWLYSKLSALRHSNGAPLLQIFGKHHLPQHRELQGGIINFELLRPDGSVYSYKAFETEAAEAGFHVRTGAECNPGACYSYLGVQESEVQQLAGKKEGCEDDVEFIEVQRPAEAAGVVSSIDLLPTLEKKNISLGHPAEVALKWVQVPLGSVRASLGYMSTFEDCFALYSFIKERYTDIQDAPAQPQQAAGSRK